MNNDNENEYKNSADCDNELEWLLDPTTARRYLPEKHIWLGNENNVEDAVEFDPDKLELNLRDLIARLHLLKQKLDYICRSRLLIPFKNKYLPNSQVLHDLDPAILKHKNGIVEEAIAGKDYVDVGTVSDGKFCVIRPGATGTSDKFIAPSDIAPETIVNIYNEVKKTINEISKIYKTINNVYQTINNITREIHNHFGGIDIDLSGLWDIIKKILKILEGFRIPDIKLDLGDIWKWIKKLFDLFNLLLGLLNGTGGGAGGGIINIITNLFSILFGGGGAGGGGIIFNLNFRLNLILDLFLSLNLLVNNIVTVITPLISFVNVIAAAFNIAVVQINQNFASITEVIGYLKISIHNFNVALSQLNINLLSLTRRITLIENRFQIINQRFVNIDSRFVAVNQRFVAVEQSINVLITKIVGILSIIELFQSNFVLIDNRITVLEGIVAELVSSSNCIAWAIAHDDLTIEWN